MGKILEEFESNGIKCEFFTKCVFKDIEASECKIPCTEVIDFDKTKRKIVSKVNTGDLTINEFKSSDCLKFIPKSNRIDFIEIKGLKEYIKRFKENPNRVKTCEKLINDFALNIKYKDSVTILHLLIQCKELNLKKGYSEHIKNIEPNFIIVTDIDTEKDGIASLVLAMKYREADSIKLDKKLIEKLRLNISNINVIPQSKKKLIYEGKLDEYYKDFI